MLRKGRKVKNDKNKIKGKRDKREHEKQNKNDDNSIINCCTCPNIKITSELISCKMDITLQWSKRYTVKTFS